jgi:hypothetical protein
LDWEGAGYPLAGEMVPALAGTTLTQD